jgi:2-polyprenyl-3-methyl-5-hydroxy-6-metoxy-1,4-benzoquinol methylase
MSEYVEYEYTHSGPRHSFGYLMAPVLSMLDPKKNRTVLDLGCGNGYLASQLVKLGYNAYGTDASENGIAIAKQEYPDRFYWQDLSTGKLPKELQSISFDTIISTEVIEHLYDPGGFIDFCKEILPQNGEIILSTPYHGYFKNLMLSVLNLWDAHLSPTWHGGHIKFWSRETLSQLLTEKGFKVTQFKGCGRAPYFWKSMIIKAILQ